MDLTIVIPSFRRTDFLRRQFKFHAALGFGGRLLIGDASDDDAAAAVRADISRYPDLDVDYRHMPGVGVVETFAALAEATTTAYVACCGDDDLLVPAGLQACADHLGAAPATTIAANGEGMLFAIGSAADAFGEPRALNHYSLFAIDAPTAAERVARLLARYWVPLFGVHRTSAWQRMWGGVAAIPDRAIGGELLPACRAAALGRTDHLAVPLVLRQAHDSHDTCPELVRWIAAPSFSPSYAALEDSLSALIAELDGDGEAAREPARELVATGISRYIATKMTGPRSPALDRVKAPLRAVRNALHRVQLRADLARPDWRAAFDALAASALTAD